MMPVHESFPRQGGSGTGPGAEPLVSIIMPAYNAEDTIAASIESVCRQSWQHWELLIVVDAATDGTLQVAQAWAARDARIHVLSSAVNQGTARSRNLALDHVRGAYVAFLDSDDLWMERKLAAQMAFMISTGVRICYACYRRFEGARLLNTVVPPEILSYRQLLKGNAIGNLTAVVDGRVAARLRFQAVGHEDYLFWLSALKIAGSARRLPGDEPMALYRVRSASLSGSKWRSMGWQWYIYRQQLGLSRLFSFWLMLNYGIRAVRKRLGVAGQGNTTL